LEREKSERVLKAQRDKQELGKYTDIDFSKYNEAETTRRSEALKAAQLASEAK
jgi:hypothetical protein